MASGSTKQKVIETIEALPPDAAVEDAMERLSSWRRSSAAWNRQMLEIRFLTMKRRSDS